MRRALACTSLLLLAPLASAADTIELVNGDKLSGNVIEKTADHVVLEHAVLGRVEIPVAQIKPPEAPSRGLFGTSFLAGWTRTFQLGVSGAQGNAKNNDVLAALDLDYEDEQRRWSFDAAYRFGAADGETTEHDAFAQLRRDWLLDESRWFFFAIGRFDYDKFKSWTYRLNGSGGIGYQFVKGERFELQGLFGPSLTKQFQEDDFFVEALVGLEAIWKIAPDHSLELSNTIYPALNDPGEFRNLSSLSWKWKLTEDPELSLIAAVDNEYESDVESGIKHDDVRYSTSIGIDF
jgi:hypothetical protein